MGLRLRRGQLALRPDQIARSLVRLAELLAMSTTGFITTSYPQDEKFMPTVLSLAIMVTDVERQCRYFDNMLKTRHLRDHQVIIKRKLARPLQYRCQQS